jgi:hypothetical protein
MRVPVCLGFLLLATAAHAQSTPTTVNRQTNSVTTTGQGYGATTTRTSSTTTYTTTITRNPGGYQPMGAGAATTRWDIDVIGAECRPLDALRASWCRNNARTQALCGSQPFRASDSLAAFSRKRLGGKEYGSSLT